MKQEPANEVLVQELDELIKLHGALAVTHALQRAVDLRLHPVYTEMQDRLAEISPDDAPTISESNVISGLLNRVSMGAN